MCGCLSCAPYWGTWPATQACALTGNRTGDPLVHRPVLNPPSHTSQGTVDPFAITIMAPLELCYNLLHLKKYI